jgi:hypothetical protein
MLVVGTNCAVASDKEATHSLLQAGARIRYYESQKRYGTDIKAGTGYYAVQSSGSEYKSARDQFILAFIQLTEGERSNERFARLECALFPVRNESIFDAEDKAKFREFLMATSASNVGLRAVEYGRKRNPDVMGISFVYYYVYTLKNGKTLSYGVRD